MTASPVTISFLGVQDLFQHPSGVTQDYRAYSGPPRTAEGKLLTPKQIRARARRKTKRSDVMSDQELEYLYKKPVEEWDLEELAHGRPKGKDGRFRGPRPKWINAAIHERAMEKYTAAVKGSMRETTVDALQLLKDLIANDDVDDKGKPIVPAGTKLEAAKFLIEHVVGKPTQRIESDISVKLQGILGSVIVNPNDMGSTSQNYSLGHFPGVTMELATALDDDDEYLEG